MNKMRKYFKYIYSCILAYGLIFFGGLGGVAAFVLIDIWLTLCRMNNIPMESWPNIAPQMRVVYIPIISFIVSIPAAFFSMLLYFLGWRAKGEWFWLLIGASYSLLVGWVIFRGIFDFWSGFFISFVFLVLSLILVYRYFAIRFR